VIWGYCRVSSKGQETNGNSLESQESALREAGATVIYKDTFTGTKTDRPELNKLLAELKSGDTLIITKLDRIARSLSQGSELVNSLIEKGIRVNILNIGILDNTPASKLIRNIFFAFAEFEKDMILERCADGKAVAKTKPGYREGRPREYTDEQLRHALSLLKDHSYTEVEKMTKISKSTLIRAKRNNNVNMEMVNLI